MTTDAAKTDTQKQDSAAGKEGNGEPSGKGKEPSFEELLAQYGKEPKSDQKKEPEKPAATAAERDKLKEEIRGEVMAEMRVRDRAEKDFDKLVDDVAEESGFSKTHARSWLLGEFDDNRLMNAWAVRTKDKDGWSKVKDGLLGRARESADEVASKRTRQDRDLVSVRAAARTKTGSSPEKKYPSGMETWSDSKFEAWKREQLRQ